MDRSFWSDREVIAASLDFVCVRLATFEDAEETAFTQALYNTRRNRQVNTVFTILAPDGKTTLLAPGRSPMQALGGSEDPQELVAAMKKIAAKYKGRRSKTPPIPYGIDLRRALNVAACDMQPLVVVVAKTAAKRTAIEKALAPLAWSKELSGVFAYTTAKPNGLETLSGANATEGILVVQADAYGLQGKVLASAAGTGAATLKAALKKGLAAFRSHAKDSIRHIRYARMNGIRWEPEVKSDASRPRR